MPPARRAPRYLDKLPTPAREFVASLLPTRRPGTCWQYASTLRRFHRWLARRDLRVGRLTRRQLAPWFTELHADGLDVGTRRMALIRVRAYLRWLDEHAHLSVAADDLIRSQDLPKLPSYLPRPLTRDADRELQRRLAASLDPWAWALLLMRRTGIRIGELRDLEYACVRADDPKRCPLLKVPLGKLQTERLVPIDASCVDIVRRLQALPPRPRYWLVVKPTGRQVSYLQLSQTLASHTNELPDSVRVTSHRLRHTYATEMLEAGMSLVGVMRLLGHRDFRMTLRYTAITPETVSDEYTRALTRVSTKYGLAPAPHKPPPDPDDLLDQLARWLRKHAPSRLPSRPLLKRIERLKSDVRALKKHARPSSPRRRG
jgi:site-specific recombinase XerD